MNYQYSYKCSKCGVNCGVCCYEINGQMVDLCNECYSEMEEKMKDVRCTECRTWNLVDPSDAFECGECGHVNRVTRFKYSQLGKEGKARARLEYQKGWNEVDIHKDDIFTEWELNGFCEDSEEDVFYNEDGTDYEEE